MVTKYPILNVVCPLPRLTDNVPYLSSGINIRKQKMSICMGKSSVSSCIDILPYKFALVVATLFCGTYPR